MKLSREAIQRMVGGVGMGSVSSGGGGEGFAGYATQSWVNTNFVSIEFFGRLFKAYGPGENQGDPDVEVLPNDMDSTISNIEAMFGFWTDFYLTALGNGGEIGASIYLSGLADVNVAGVANGQVLTWNSAQNKWIATTPSSGVDMTVVWNALAASTSQQINASHLSTALADYATQTWVGQQGYITAAALNGYATETWVGQQLQSYIPKHNIESTSGSIPSWGTLTSSNGYSAGAIWSFPGGSDLAFAYKNGQVSMQVDGMFYQREGNYECIDSGGGQTIGGTLGVTGTITCGNLYSNGYVTALSDKREKNIIEHFEVSLKYIAEAPVVSYTWKDTGRRGDKQQIGSIAQYWLREMPELVPEVNGRYTMDYGRIALLSAILTARHVVNLEQRIAELEKALRGE